MNIDRICNAAELENLINSTPDGGVCVLPKKEYYIERQVVIKNKKDITVDGNGALVISKYDNTKDYTASVDAFLIDGCNNVTFGNLVMDTSVPANVTATVMEINRDEKWVVLKVDNNFEMYGNEVLMSFNTMDSEGSPDYHMNYYSKHPDPNIVTLILGEILLANTYASAKYDYLGNNTFKVYFGIINNSLCEGERMCIRHTMYGNSAITLKDSNDTVINNITMHHVPGMAIIVLPRCKNLTVDGLKVVSGGKWESLMPGNCDGIHLTGLYGDFVMKNCVFDGMGDDALNVHATAGTITELIDENNIRCGYCKKGPDGVLPERWCEEGDIIKAYNPDTMVNTAVLKAVSFEDGILNFEVIEGGYALGDTLQNMTYAPSCEIEGCVIRNTRARGLIIQTSNVEIKNCTFFGMSSCAVKVAPDFKYWYEVGPTYNFNMHHNVIEKCAFRSENVPSIGIFTKHGPGIDDIFHVHKNIKIENNLIKRANRSCITVTASDGVVVSGNVFENRAYNDVDCINVVNCTDVTVENNIEK